MRIRRVECGGVTQWGQVAVPAHVRMRFLILAHAAFPLFLVSLPAPAQETQAEEFRVYTEHPRLFLRPQRLRLLKRERERQSMRWRQIDMLLGGKAQMPEHGFASALYYQVKGDAGAGKRAIEWALSPEADLRQIAVVLDWCQDLLSEDQTKLLAARLEKGLTSAPAGNSVAAERDRVLAAIALAERNQDLAEKVLRDAVQKWWRKELAPALSGGRNLDPGSEVFPLLEILHAVRDNLNIDLRQDAPSYFKSLPSYEVVCNYPAAYPAPENEYHIPFYTGSGEPDLNRASLARAAGLALVAYDTNELENQYLQGWLIQDRFILKSAFGAPYEFLWANPYQPGLSYDHLPVLFYDERSGTLVVRSDWEEDALWFALENHQAQLFRDGKITVLDLQGRQAGKSEAIHVGTTTILMGRPNLRFQADGEEIFIIGGRPRAKYHVEIDDEEMQEKVADAGGNLELLFDGESNPGVRIHAEQ